MAAPVIPTKASDLMLGMKVFLPEIAGSPSSGRWMRVVSLELVGDDVVVNDGEVTTSIGNTFDVSHRTF